MSTGLGVDLHPYYQRGTNALPGVEYGWLKMCDGAAVYSKTVGGVVYTAEAHAALFRRLGVPFGGYVYAQPGDGAAEARVLWAECQRLGGTGVAPGVDIESGSQHTWSVSEARDHGRAFCAQMRKLGVRPAVYMGLDLLQATDPASWPEDPVIWAPRYGARPDAGGRYTHGYDVHQYSSTGSLPGSAGAVDWNQSYRRGTTTTPGTAHLITVMEDDVNLTDQLTAYHANGQSFTTTVGDALAKLPALLECVRPGAGWQVTDGWLSGALSNTNTQIPAISAKVDALATTVANLATSPDATPEQIKQWLTDAVAANLRITGTVEITGAERPAAAAQ